MTVSLCQRRDTFYFIIELFRIILQAYSQQKLSGITGSDNHDPTGQTVEESPLLKFCYIYFIKRGFLDGRDGLTYCILQTIYEYMITIKMKELKRQEKGLPI